MKLKSDIFNLCTFSVVLMLIVHPLYATVPTGYYNGVEGKSGDQIVAALYAAISSHTDVGYDGLYNVYPTSDLKQGTTNQVWDMYSTCTFIHGQKKCGSYSNVCDCYNREHSVPQSWFGEASPMKSDAFHVFPTDGKVNGQRSNYPLGECSGGTYLNSQALGRLGSSTFQGYTNIGTVFEVADEYKGDFARAYFYMVTCYRNKSFTSSGGNKVFTYSGGVAGLTPYAIALFIKWHRQDPVSQKEIDRNEAIYAYQNNRNPYIDHPCLAEYIWGNKAGQTVSLATLDSCNCTDCGQGGGGGGGNPPVEWGLEPVTDIHNTSAILHWTDAHVASYMVDVFTVSTSGYEEDIVLHDLHGANTTSRSGYTEVVKVNADSAIRLGSGSNRGAITYAGLDFSLGGRVVVRASQYSSDTGAPFYIMVGNDSAHYAAAATPGDYQLSVDTMSGQQTLTISTLEKGKRIYVYEVTVITGGEQSDTLHITGYPQNVGNVLQHQVTGLDSNTIYTYRVTPDGMQGAEGVFQTENGWTGWDFVPFPDLEYRPTDRGVMLMGVPREAIVTVFDAMGRMVHTTTGAANPLLLDLPEGLSLIRVVHEGKSQLIKLTN